MRVLANTDPVIVRLAGYRSRSARLMPAGTWCIILRAPSPKSGQAVGGVFADLHMAVWQRYWMNRSPFIVARWARWCSLVGFPDSNLIETFLQHYTLLRFEEALRAQVSFENMHKKQHLNWNFYKVSRHMVVVMIDHENSTL